jgi:hypothetical protein
MRPYSNPYTLSSVGSAVSESSTAATTCANLCRTLRAATPLLFLGPKPKSGTNTGRDGAPAAAGAWPFRALPRRSRQNQRGGAAAASRSLRSLATNSRGMAVAAAAPTN